MAKTNFSYEKRQRELEKKKKTEEKARKKQEAKHSPAGEDGSAPDADEVQDETAPEASDPA